MGAFRSGINRQPTNMIKRHPSNAMQMPTGEKSNIATVGYLSKIIGSLPASINMLVPGLDKEGLRKDLEDYLIAGITTTIPKKDTSTDTDKKDD